MTIDTNRPKKPKTALITGASQGLGLAFAKALAAEGWNVVVTARTAERLAEAADEIAAVPGAGTVTALPGDVVDDDHRADLAEATADLGGADLLVNNASTLGGSPMPKLGTFPLPALLDTFEVNVLAPIALTQLVLPQLREREGSVINVSSDAAAEPYEGWGGYGASKAALDHASAILALEEPKLHVWAIDPGDMRTQMHQDAFPGEDISDRPLPETVVPALLTLLRTTPPSGRYLASHIEVLNTEGEH